MTNLQEAKLAREAEIVYVTVGHGDRLTISGIRIMIPSAWIRSLPVLVKNAEKCGESLFRETKQPCRRPLCKGGPRWRTQSLPIRKKIPPATRKKLKLILGKYSKAK